MHSSRGDADWEAIRGGKYLSFATRKRSGEFIETPVWFAPDDNGFVIFSAGHAGKVKRLRNFSESRIAACTLAGKITGPWVATEAFILDAPDEKSGALKILREKYGWVMKSGDFFASLVGRMQGRAYIRVQQKD